MEEEIEGVRWFPKVLIPLDVVFPLLHCSQQGSWASTTLCILHPVVRRDRIILPHIILPPLALVILLFVLLFMLLPPFRQETMASGGQFQETMASEDSSRQRALRVVLIHSRGGFRFLLHHQLRCHRARSNVRGRQIYWLYIYFDVYLKSKRFWEYWKVEQ